MNAPTSAPSRKVARPIVRTSFQYSASRHTAASVMRTELKSRGETSSSACLMTTKVAPQTKVTSTSRTWALSERDTQLGYQTGQKDFLRISARHPANIAAMNKAVLQIGIQFVMVPSTK